jgi:Na+/proline symporter
MSIVIAVAYYAIHAVGGMGPLLRRLSNLQHSNPNSGNAVAFFPDFTQGFTHESLWTIPVITLLVNLGLQWWAFWYPGAEPGGGGYIAQRIFSARDERHGVLSVLWFNVAHYALRPWPWILTALAAIVLYPGLEHPEDGYMLVVTHHVPAALRGIVIAGFMAAFMSTVATQLNWGASYLVADFYRRFVRKSASEHHYVLVSRLCTILLVIIAAVVSANLSSIKGGWTLVLEIGAGTGAVYLLRWYWWRINAWSEISAMATSLGVTVLLHWSALWMRLVGRPQLFSGSAPVVFAESALVTTVVTTLVWLTVTYATRPEPKEVLVPFYRKVRPDVRGWKPVAALLPEVAATHNIGRDLWAWLLGCAMVYMALFGSGKLLMKDPVRGIVLLAASALAGITLYRQQSRYHWGAIDK